MPGIMPYSLVERGKLTRKNHTSNNLGEEEQMHSFVYSAGTVFIRVNVIRRWRGFGRSPVYRRSVQSKRRRREMTMHSKQRTRVESNARGNIKDPWKAGERHLDVEDDVLDDELDESSKLVLVQPMRSFI